MSEGPSHNQLLFHHHQQQQPQPSQQLQTHSRYGRGLRSTPGEIVKVQGGHIVRSTGRKDRHSKVCTAKGPRDRRVRLSAHTAIQFYDVQDRLGYDRPSKAVDWLMKNAKAAIDDLAELPPWHPTAVPNPTISSQQNSQEAAAVPAANVHGYGGGDGGGGSFLPPSLDSDAIADTIKSFFPMGTAASSTTASSSSPIGFQNYPPDFLSRASSHNQPPDFLSRTSSHNQDLRLSLHSFQDTIYQHHPNAPHHHQQQQQNSGANIFAGFDTAAMVNPWNNIPESSGGGYVFNVPSLGQSQFFTTQRGPLQSSNQPFVRAWVDPIANNAAAAGVDSVVQQPSVQSFGFASGSGFAGFRIPAWIQGEEEHDGVPDKPSSASSGSHH